MIKYLPTIWNIITILTCWKRLKCNILVLGQPLSDYPHLLSEMPRYCPQSFYLFFSFKNIYVCDTLLLVWIAKQHKNGKNRTKSASIAVPHSPSKWRLLPLDDESKKIIAVFIKKVNKWCNNKEDF